MTADSAGFRDHNEESRESHRVKMTLYPSPSFPIERARSVISPVHNEQGLEDLAENFVLSDDRERRKTGT